MVTMTGTHFFYVLQLINRISFILDLDVLYYANLDHELHEESIWYQTLGCETFLINFILHVNAGK